MPIVAVNVIKVAFVVVLYLFVFYVARSMRGHIVGPPVDASATPTPPSVGRDPSPDAPPPASPDRAIVVTATDGVAVSHPLNGTVVVGRGDSADIKIQDEYASDLHASFTPTGHSVVVEDLGSTNGTTIDDRRVEGRVEVLPGTFVFIGRTRVAIK